MFSRQVNVSISGGSNDVNDSDATSNEIEWGKDKDGGFRFENITIPFGATILSTYLFLTPNETDSKNGSGGSGSSTCSGNADALHASNAGFSSGATGAPDNNGAQLSSSGEYITLDLTDVINAGESYDITWRIACTGGNATASIEESSDGTNFTANGSSPFTLTSSSFGATTITAGTDTRYVRITSTNAICIQIDAISYSNVSCGGSGGGSTCVYKDEFQSQSFSNNDGTSNWLTDWIESPADNGAAGQSTCCQSGYSIYVATNSDYGYNYCPNSGSGQPCLYFDLNSAAATAGNYIYRSVDLSNASTATLTYDYDVAGGSGNQLDMDVSTDGSSWTTLKSHTSSSGSETTSLDAYLTSNTRIRFRRTATGGGDVGIDNVQIQSSCSGSGSTCTYRDEFTSVSYTNSHGTQDWSASAWQEFNDLNSATGSSDCFSNDHIIAVSQNGDCVYGYCPGSNNCLTFRMLTTGNGDYISRQLDLSSATSATLTFDYNMSNAGSDEIQLQVRTGSGAWSTLATYNTTTSGSESYDLSGHLAADTEIRFIQNAASGGYFGVDNVQVSFSCSSGSGSSGTTLPNADYTIDNGGTINTCTGTFTDSGNSNGNYGDNESQTITFCSDQNNHISFTFEHFNTEATNDFLTIYDGNSTGATQLGSYSGIGDANSPGVVTSSGTCLTFSFLSNGSSNANGWYASISCTGQPPVGASTPSWAGYPSTSACGSTAQLGGNVFEDNNNNGTKDTEERGLYGIAVTLYDDNGQVGTPTATDANGDYTFSGLTATTVYRVEFTVPDGMAEGPFGAGSGTAVQFVQSGQCDADLGLIDPAFYCDSADPYFVIPCYANGDPQHSSNAGSTGVARFRYSDFGDSPSPTYTNFVTVDAVGTVWGVAYDGDSDKLYMATVLKRHAGLGPDGIGAIYSHNDGDPAGNATLFYDFGAAAGTVANNATRFPGGGSGFGQEGPCGPCDNIDPTTFAQIGKVGLGDIDINPEHTKLYVSNLYDRKIYAIDINNPTAGSAIPLPGIPWLDNSPCTNGVARPWAVEFRRGKLYVGVVCDASLSSCTATSPCNDLTAEIYSFDGATWTNELSFSLDYYRKAYSVGANYFSKWIDNWNVMSPFVSNVTDANFNQPIIMGIEVDDDNALIIGIGDRSGFQLGYRSAPPGGPSSSTAERNFAFGDILKAGYNAATDTYTLENNGLVGGLTTTNPTNNTGPGGKSFFYGDYWTGIGANRFQSGIGPLLVLPNKDEVVFPIADAEDYYSNGISWMSNLDGSDVKRLEVYQGTSNGNSPNFAKSSGVGDMVALCETRPIEIGNIVWWDEDLDGLQDPSEPGIPNVAIELWLDPNGSAQGNNPLDASAVKVASTTTDAYGRYIFSFDGNSNGLSAENWSYTIHNKVLADTFYQVRIPNWETDAGVVAYRNTIGYTAHMLSSTQNQTGTDGAGGTARDNNGYDNPGNAAGAVQTGSVGNNDHNFDFGFGGVGGCVAPEVIPTANTPCEGSGLNFSTNVTGGTAPYAYNWSGPNSFTSNIGNPTIASVDSALNVGIYSLTVTDALGCEDTTHIHVAINKVTITATATDATCGSNDGATNLNISGIAPFIIDWDNDGTGDNDDTEDLTSLTAGSYNVTVTDADGCTANTGVSVGSSGSVTLTHTGTNETCSSANGSIDLTITGTHTTIDWSNDGTGDNDDTEDLSGLSAGTYSVTVNNAANCPATLSVTLTDTPGPSNSFTQINTTCGNNNGSIDLTVNGGVAPYTFDWDNDGIGDNDDPEDLTNLSAGTYNVTITDATSCTTAANVTLTNTAGPTLSHTFTNETCSNANGSIDLTVSGGVAPYTYNWSNSIPTEDLSGIGTGTYQVTVVDANNCTASTSVAISNTIGPTLTATAVNATDCNTTDGSIDLVVSGGTPPYAFDWDNDGTGDNDDTEDLTGIAAGNYMVIVTDANGCQITASVTVLQTAAILLTTTITDPTTCLETGSVDLTVAGGVPPYTFDWSDDGLGENDDTEDITGLAGGIYTVVVTDGNGCLAQTNISIRVIRDPALSGIIVNPSCGVADGAITLNISDPDGSGPYTFDWNNDGVGDNDDTQNQTALSTGNYSVTVTNAISCTAEMVFSLAPTTAAPTLTVIQNNPTCNNFDGSIDLIITGGTAPYIIDWDNDGVGDNDDPEDISGLTAGTYGVTVTDNNNCEAAEAATLVAPGLPSLNGIVTVESNCASNGEIDLTVSGVAPFTFDWDNDGTGDNDDLEDLTGLSANTYNVTVTDTDGCIASTSIMVSNVVNSRIDSLIADRAICPDGIIDTLAITTTFNNPDSIAFVYFTTRQTDSTIIYTGGIGLDTVQVSALNDTIILTNINAPAFINTSTQPDTFFVYAIASNQTNCTRIQSYEEILVMVSPQLSVTAAGIAPTCTGTVVNADGTIQLTGFTNERYDFNIGTTYTGSATYATATVIPPGGIITNSLANPTDSAQYTVRIFDANDCYIDRTITIYETNCLVFDWGDLPDTSAGTSNGNYQTDSTNNGPSHAIISGLNLGNTIDDETNGQASTTADGDGVDDDGLDFPSTMQLTPGGTMNIPLIVTNTTGNTAYLEAWIDWNGDGDFDDVNEMIVDIDDSATTFPGYVTVTIPSNVAIDQDLGVRVRLSNEDNMTPYGQVNSGEVEDYLIQTECNTTICLPVSN